MSDTLTHIKETLDVIARENNDSEEVFEVISFIVTLIAACDPKRLTKAHIARQIKVKRLTIDVKYGDRHAD